MDFISMLSHVVLYFQAKKLTVFDCLLFYIIIFLWLASLLPLQGKVQKLKCPSGEVLSVKENLV